MGCKDEEHTLKSVGDTAGKVDANTVTGGLYSQCGNPEGEGQAAHGWAGKPSQAGPFELGAEG